MKYLSKGLLYHGMKETLNGKTIFMETYMHVPQVRKEVVKRMTENPEFREKIGYSVTPFKDGAILQLGLYEDDMARMFDEICGKNLEKYLKNADESMRFYSKPLLEDKKEISCDITWYILFSIVIHETCRKRIEAVITKREEYYSLWEENRMDYDMFEMYIPEEYIWDYRLLAGMVEKMRDEDYKGTTYRKFFDIIYAGYDCLKEEMKDKKYLTIQRFRDIWEELEDESEEIKNIFPVLCEMALMMVVAEDMNIPVVMDYDFVVAMQFLEDDVEEMKKELESASTYDGEYAEDEYDEDAYDEDEWDGDEFDNEEIKQLYKKVSKIEKILSKFDKDGREEVYKWKAMKEKSQKMIYMCINHI